jgi:predicted nucleic acid-binding protein
MNGNKVLLDSNILIYLSKGILNFNDFLTIDQEICVSVVTYTEVMGYQFQNQDEENLVRRIFSELNILPITQEIADIAIHYRKIRKIKLPDAFILASAKHLDCQLLTANVADFINIDSSISIINPLKS